MLFRYSPTLPDTLEPIIVLQQPLVTHQVQQSNTNMTQPAFEMPLHNEQTALTFDNKSSLVSSKI